MEVKLGAKLLSTTRDNSIVKFAPLDDAFSEFFELEASPVQGQSLQQKDKKKRKRKSTKNEKKYQKESHFLVQKSQTFHFCACQSEKVAKHGASEKNGMLPCCKCLPK